MSSLLNSSIIFTRYLYLKDEVEISLISSILNKRNDEAIFWAYELYYSGFTEDFLGIIWHIYFGFFATLNPSFEAYLITKQKQLCISEEEEEEEEKETLSEKVHVCIANIIHNLLIRNYNTDVFYLREFIVKNDYESNKNVSLLAALESKNYNELAYHIIKCPNDMQVYKKISEVALKYFTEKGLKSKLFNDWVKTSKKVPVDKGIILLSRIMHYYTLLNKDIRIGKSIYVSIEAADLVVYDTLQVQPDEKIDARKLLEIAVIYPIDTSYLSLFKLENRPENILDIYHNDWLYYACFSPIWRERVLSYHGRIDHESKKIIFEENAVVVEGEGDGEDEFYENYGYDPEEQTIQTQEKNITPIAEATILTWNLFFEKHPTTLI